LRRTEPDVLRVTHVSSSGHGLRSCTGSAVAGNLDSGRPRAYDVAVKTAVLRLFALCLTASAEYVEIGGTGTVTTNRPFCGS
jgi:hypothetical protein